MHSLSHDLSYWRGCKIRILTINLIPISKSLDCEASDLSTNLVELIKLNMLQGNTVLVRFEGTEDQDALPLRRVVIEALYPYYDSIAVFIHTQNEYQVIHADKGNEAELTVGDVISVDELTPA